MNLVPRGRKLEAFTRINEGEELVDFSRVAEQDFFRNDIIRTRITGTIPSLSNLNVANFVESILHDIFAEAVNFEDCDFKDTLIRGAAFYHCNFTNSTFATSFLSDCEFNDCLFHNASAHNSEFHRVVFRDCNLKNILMKSSRFIDCQFLSCATNNRIVEMSTLDGTKFLSTDIQLQTITGNFGVSVEDLIDAKIRSGRVREDYHYLDSESLEAELRSQRWSPIECLRIDYFLHPDLVHGSQYLDQALDLSRWTQIYKNPGSFVELLEGFSEFMTHLYANGRLTAHSILLFHHVTSSLMELLPQREELHRLAMSLGGAHMVLSRAVEEFLETLDLLLEKAEHKIIFLVEGPFDASYFSQELAPWFDPDLVQVDFLIEHNSPLELGIIVKELSALAPLIAIFLATRTKLEIIRIHDRHLSVARKAPSSKRRLPEREAQQSEQLVSFTAGMSNESPRQYEIQVRSLLPGSLLVDLRLQVGTQIAGKIRKIILDLLS